MHGVMVSRANYRLGNGDINGAIDDIITIRLLGSKTQGSGLLIANLIGIAIEGISINVGVDENLDNLADKEQLQRYLREVHSIPEGVSLETMLQTERLGMLDVVQALATDKDFAAKMNKELFSGEEMPFWFHMACDWNGVAERINERWHISIRTGFNCYEKYNFDSYNWLLPNRRSEMKADVLSEIFAPAVESALEANYRVGCSENLQDITLAMLIYEKEHGTLPPAYTVDAAGNPLQSWRVLLLPYLGEEELYGKIKLDEPWDSEYNRQFHDAALDVYQCPSAELSPGETTYTVIVGKKTAFRPGEGKKLADFGPKSRNMILVTESTTPVNWMDPASEVTEIAISGYALESFGGEWFGSRKIGSPHPGGANFGLRSGAVWFMAETTDSEAFKGMLEGTSDEPY